MGSITDWDSKTVIGNRAGLSSGKASEKDVNAARRAGTAIETERKSGNGDHQRIAALDRKDDPTPPATISAEVGKAMQKARQDLNITQKDLGQKTNEKPQVIGDYESGRAIPSPQVLAKFEKILKVHLRGKNIGEPLLSPSEKKAAEAAKGKKK